MSLLSNWNRLPSLNLISDIAQGKLDLTHEALDAKPQVTSVIYARAVLVAAGALPARDEHTARLHRFTTEVLQEVEDPDSRKTLARYARWHVVARAKTDRLGKTPASVAHRCRGEIRLAQRFLEHLTTHGQTLDHCSQACIDGWLSSDQTRRLIFIRWLVGSGYLAGCHVPEPGGRSDPGHDVDPESQLQLARSLLHDPASAPLEDRAAACLILLYAQPIAKIVTLTTDDINTGDDGTYMKLGREPLLLIPPLDALVNALPVAKPFGTASYLADRRWLFTGKRAGEHLHAASLMRRMNQLGVRARASRNTALLHLAATTPPAVFASLIGVHINTATRWASLAGANWTTYPARHREPTS